MKYLYKYPQAAYPYANLVETNRSRSRQDFEYELLDTGVFDQDRYFDLFVEYAKASPEDILIQITIHNRGPVAGLRGHQEVSGGPALARLPLVLRVFPRRQRCWPRRQPSDRLDWGHRPGPASVRDRHRRADARTRQNGGLYRIRG